jgi:integrase
VGRVFNRWIRNDSFEKAWSRMLVRARSLYAEETEAPTQGFLEDLNFHDLRHEAISRLFELGLNPIEVAAISGHKTLQMLKRYTHLKAADLAKKLG